MFYGGQIIWDTKEEKLTTAPIDPNGSTWCQGGIDFKNVTHLVYRDSGVVFISVDMLTAIRLLKRGKVISSKKYESLG